MAMLATIASMKAANTQPYRPRLPNSFCAAGSAVLTASASKAIRVTSSTKPIVMARRDAAHNPSRFGASSSTATPVSLAAALRWRSSFLVGSVCPIGHTDPTRKRR
jgi:hypothetical protein